MTHPPRSAQQSRSDPERILQERFGLSAFREGQREVIEALEAHRAALAIFPTGGGKSLCFQIPALQYEGVTLVVSPLIALMKDQIDFLRSRGIEASRLDSSLSAEEVRSVEQGMRDGSLRLLYVAPERFNNERFLERLGSTRISLFAIDEAHCISEWGHNFRPDYLTLAEKAKSLGVERVLALTATATPSVAADIRASFDIPAEAQVITGFHRPNLFLSTEPTAPEARAGRLLARLRERPAGSTIVYVTLQATAERLANHLHESGIPARAYHAGMKDEVRVEVQEWWKGSDTGVVVATIAFGMGIDKADVRYVYHYNLPKGLESYSQEIGRAGRDGLPSVVELLGALDDVTTLENFAYGDTPTEPSLRSLVAELLAGPPELEVNLHSHGVRHDLRPLVLRTALTYLELMGILRQGTPFYAEYRLRPLVPLPELLDRFAGERADFLRKLFDSAKKGREWYTLDPRALAGTLGEDRTRIVAAIDYLGSAELVEVKVADSRQRFTRLDEAAAIEPLVEELSRRFARREQQEVERVAQVIELVTARRCQTGALVAHFGEPLSGPCGHCTFCRSGVPTRLPPLPELAPVETQIDQQELSALFRSQPKALGTPRQQARFLAGLSSPAISAARLTRHAAFGCLAGRPFAELIRWCERAHAS